MANPVSGEVPPEETFDVCGSKQSRKEKRKALKKLKRKQARKVAAIREREMEEFLLNDPEEQLLLRLREQEEAENAEKERRAFEERERLWFEAAAARKSREEEDERQKKLLQEEERKAYTDEEVEHSYEEFYEDVHTEFLKFGEIVNFKVCKNTSYHLRGNLYVHYKSLDSAILAFNTMNARYYAGKQIICEFVGVTRWKVAICGEYMKTRLKTCSHGSACNFIHCFRNPGGDYEWADWDNPPPRYWIKRMIFLFGTSVESGYDKKLDSEDYEKHREQTMMRRTKNYRHQSERFHHKEMDLNNSSSDGEELSSKKPQHTRYSTTRERSVKRRGQLVSEDKNELLSENHRSEERFYSKSFCSHSDDAGEGTSKEVNEGLVKKHRRYVSNTPEHDRRHDIRGEIEERSSSSRRKSKVFSEEKENSEPKSHKKQNKKQVKKDRHLENSDLRRERTHSPSNWDSFRSKDKFNEDFDSEKDSDGARQQHYSSQSVKRRKYDKHGSQQRRSHHSHKHRYITGKITKGDEQSDESPGRWKVSDEDFLVEETQLMVHHFSS